MPCLCLAAPLNPAAAWKCCPTWKARCPAGWGQLPSPQCRPCPPCPPCRPCPPCLPSPGCGRAATTRQRTAPRPPPSSPLPRRSPSRALPASPRTTTTTRGRHSRHRPSSLKVARVGWPLVYALRDMLGSATGGADSNAEISDNEAEELEKDGAVAGGKPCRVVPLPVGRLQCQGWRSWRDPDPVLPAVSTKAIQGAKSFGGFLYSAVSKAGAKVSEAGAKIKKTVEENVSTTRDCLPGPVCACWERSSGLRRKKAAISPICVRVPSAI